MDTRGKKTVLSFFVFLALTGFLFEGADAARSDQSDIQCVSLVVLDKKIKHCTDNVVALENASRCYERMEEAWKSSSRELAALMNTAVAGKKISQSNEMSTSRKNYMEAVDRMKRLVAMIDRNADLISNYPSVMVDDPVMLKSSEDLPCFTGAFQRIQETVYRLDDKIEEGLDTIDEISKLQEKTNEYAENLESSRKLASKAAKPAALKNAESGFVKKSSTISGSTSKKP